MNLFKRAKRYKNEHNLSVIPITDSKKPALSSWKEYQSKKPSNEELKSWFKDKNPAGIAAVTGEISNIAVVDVEKGGAYASATPTAVVRSGGGGYHYYYKYPSQRELKSKNRIMDKVDLKAEGGYVILPPSKHPSGNNYEWIVSLDDAELPQIPEDIIDIVKEDKDSRNIDWSQFKDKTVPKGTRNTTAISYAGYLVNKFDESEWDSHVWPILQNWNEEKVKPPLKETELKGVFNSAKKMKREEKESEENQKSKGGKKTDKAINLALGNECEYFHDTKGRTYAQVKIDETLRIVQLDSDEYEGWLSNQYYNEYNEVLSQHVLQNALTTLKGKARFEGKERKLNIRVCRKDDNIWYDLGGKDWKALKINKSGFKVVDNPPILFKRYPHQQKQSKPSVDGNISDLLDFINTKEDQEELLLLTTIISYLVPDIPHPILLIQGEHGSAKTTTLKMIREIVDPSVMGVMSFCKKEELIKRMAHNWVLFFDNVSQISQKQSDILCRAVTGEGYSERKLHTNDNEIVYELRNCLGLNGINLPATKSDLLDRSIIIELDRISPSDRKTESKLWSEFEEKKPDIFGGAVSVLSDALEIIDDIELEEKPRMADYARWGEAISRALGENPGSFMEAYRDNIEIQHDKAISSSQEAQALIEFIENYSKEEGMKYWEGTASELNKELMDINSSITDAPNHLMKELNKHKVNLEEKGVEIKEKRIGKIRRKKIVNHNFTTADEADMDIEF